MSKYQVTIGADSLDELDLITDAIRYIQTGGAKRPLTGCQTPEGVFSQPASPNVPAATPPSVATVVPSVSPAPAPAAALVTQGGAVELDPRGYYWDARIHSSSKERVVKGNLWKYKRNTPEATIAQVEAEQRAQGFGAGAAKDPDIIAPVATITSPVAPAAPSAPAPVGLPPAPVTVASAPVVEANRGVFTGERFTKYIADPTKPNSPEKTKAEWCQEVLAYYGVANLPALADASDEVLDQINAYLDSNGL